VWDFPTKKKFGEEDDPTWGRHLPMANGSAFTDFGPPKLAVATAMRQQKKEEKNSKENSGT
jgi:hypothetical protein